MDGAQSFEMIVHGSFAPQHTWPRGRGSSAVRILTWVAPRSLQAATSAEQIGSGPPALTHGANQAQSSCSSAVCSSARSPELPGPQAADSAAVRVRNQPSPRRTARSMAGPESPPMIKGIGRCTGIGHIAGGVEAVEPAREGDRLFGPEPWRSTSICSSMPGTPHVEVGTQRRVLRAKFHPTPIPKIESGRR